MSNSASHSPASTHSPGRFEAAVVRANRALLVGLMAGMAALVVANVFMRYVFNNSIVWAEELSRYMMVWVGFIGSGLVLRIGAHIAVDVFQDLLPHRVAQAMRVLVWLLLAGVFGVMAWLGFRYVSFAWGQETPVLNWNFGLIYIAVPLGALLMLLNLVFIAAPFVRSRSFRKDPEFSSEEATL
jgi:TRAP-type C4-dicarboxylate transport system permease small subunit